MDLRARKAQQIGHKCHAAILSLEQGRQCNSINFFLIYSGSTKKVAPSVIIITSHCLSIHVQKSQESSPILGYESLPFSSLSEWIRFWACIELGLNLLHDWSKCNSNFSSISDFRKSAKFSSNIILTAELALILIQIWFRKANKILVVQVYSQQHDFDSFCLMSANSERNPRGLLPISACV